jgi:hypothetical protein
LYLNIRGHHDYDRIYGSWIYNFLCYQFKSHSWGDVLYTTLCDKVCQWLAASLWFSLDTPVSFINKTDCHDITAIVLKVALNTINIDPLVFKYDAMQ